MNMPKVLVVGAGLAGSEAAMFLARRGVAVTLLESKALKLNPAQKIKTCAELVCTNSLKSKSPHSAHGVLKYEMQGMNSIVLEAGEQFSVPAGDALAVDREKFSQYITDKLKDHSLIEFKDEEVIDPLGTAKKYGCDYIIVATGPLTTTGLEQWIQSSISHDDFYFYDAIAPVVDGDSLDLKTLYYKDRHKEPTEDGLADYLNIPLDKHQYEAFVEELRLAEKVPAKDFEELKFFESCLPIDIMAERGKDTPRFSCMKPIGLERADGTRPYACVQLRRENLLGSAYNLVGFQTRLTYKEQLRVFRMLPGMEQASFLHLGSVHRNSFLNARKLLNPDLSCKAVPELYFAGQITGVEGYTESASIGLYVASQLWRKIRGEDFLVWPATTGIGALVNYIMTVPKPCPSNINFGLLPTPQVDYKGKKMKRAEVKKLKKSVAAKNAQESFDQIRGALT